VPEVAIPEERPLLNRKTQHYGPALDLALLILRAHTPSLQRGKNQALALLFDMNSLFEEYVESLLRRAATAAGCIIHAQEEKTFWTTIRARPDIVVTLQPTAQDPTPARNCILDVKWKVPKSGKPTADDMRQVYAYCHLWGAAHGLLLYPRVSEEQQPRRGIYAPSGFAEAGTKITGQTLFAPILLSNKALNPRMGPEVLSVLRTLC
jgi:5-methylcytosine-specific restriction enzyme subunit McrC